MKMAGLPFFRQGDDTHIDHCGKSFYTYHALLGSLKGSFENTENKARF
jgi:hypothetical protein